MVVVYPFPHLRAQTPNTNVIGSVVRVASRQRRPFGFTSAWHGDGIEIGLGKVVPLEQQRFLSRFG